ncbi:MAG: DUF1566 domain-containing protein [Chitinophagales bacterium]
MKNTTVLISVFLLVTVSAGAQAVIKTMKRLPDTGQQLSYTNTFGEDADFSIHLPVYKVNGDGTVTDTVTGLMWQQTDGGEMRWEEAITFCDTLTLGNYTNWRLPDCHELFSILNEDALNPAIDTNYFQRTSAEYWWSSEVQANDSSKIWVTNAGGGVGNHPKNETLSAGGTKRFHVRAVRDQSAPTALNNQFTNHVDGTVIDSLTGLIWQSIPAADSLNWEDALHYADTLQLGNFQDWRLPNIKELQSLNDESRINPSLNTSYFPLSTSVKYWSSTSLRNQPNRAWFLDTHFGITSYADKNSKQMVLCVRNNSLPNSIIDEKAISALFYPNPFNTTIQYSESLNGATFSIIDVLGKTVVTGNFEGALDLQDLPKGIYQIIVQNALFPIHRMLLKQ